MGAAMDRACVFPLRTKTMESADSQAKAVVIARMRGLEGSVLLLPEVETAAYRIAKISVQGLQMAVEAYAQITRGVHPTAATA